MKDLDQLDNNRKLQVLGVDSLRSKWKLTYIVEHWEEIILTTLLFEKILIPLPPKKVANIFDSRSSRNRMLSFFKSYLWCKHYLTSISSIFWYSRLFLASYCMIWLDLTLLTRFVHYYYSYYSLFIFFQQRNGASTKPSCLW